MSQLRVFWRQTWDVLPLDQQLLLMGVGLLTIGFAALFWTPLGNRQSARYCFALAVLSHLLLWGVARQVAPASGPTVAARPTASSSIDLSVDSNEGGEEIQIVGSAENGTAKASAERRLKQEIQDPRDLSKPVLTEQKLRLAAADRPITNGPAPLEQMPTPRQQTIEPASSTPLAANRSVRATPDLAKEFSPTEPPPSVREPKKNADRASSTMESSLPIVSTTRGAMVTALQDTKRETDTSNEQPTMPEMPAATEANSGLSGRLTKSRPSTSDFEVFEPAEAAAPQATKKKAELVEKSDNEIFRLAKPLAKMDQTSSLVQPTVDNEAIAMPSRPTSEMMQTSAAMDANRSMSSPANQIAATGQSRSAKTPGDEWDTPEPAPTSAPRKIEMAMSSAAAGPTNIRAVGPGGVLDQRRSGVHRQEMLDRYGGNQQTERAVANALIWLAAHQHADGHWDGDDFMQNCPPGERCDGKAIESGSDVGITGIATLAFLGAGHTHTADGPYRETVRKALSWILLEQAADGEMTGRDRLGRIYSHAIASLTLTEAYQLTADERLKSFAQKGVTWLVRAQHPELGGWRYAPRQDSDTSVYGWVVLALASAKQSGLEVPSSCWEHAQTWLPRVSMGLSGGLACYQPGRAHSPAMTAEALVCRQLFGIAKDADACTEAAAYILERAPDRREPNVYYWYYGTLAMFQVGGARWERWNDALQRTLLEGQRQTGHHKGSWDPEKPFGVDGGRVFSTAAAALCLEVYYRHLPIYKDSSSRR